MADQKGMDDMAVPSESIKAKLRYRCKACGCEEVVAGKMPEWQMSNDPPFLKSSPQTDFSTGQTGYILPPVFIWHECHKDLRSDKPPLGYGVCELVGIIPEKVEKSVDE